MKQIQLLIVCGLGLLLLGVLGGYTSDSAACQKETVAKSQIYDAVMAIKKDIENSNIPGLQEAHLNSPKFSKFGPRKFERQDVEATNESEEAFFSSISDASYKVKELKIDVFKDVGIATYYPVVSFVRDGERIKASGRQTLVFINTRDGWKLIHEHGTGR